MMDVGEQIFGWIKDLFPLNRSLSGVGNRQTLSYLQDLNLPIEIKRFSPGNQYFDWTMPNEWQVNHAYIADRDGNRLVDFENNNLHLLGYSHSVNKKLELNELLPHLYISDEDDAAIPYVTSYYQSNWGFCLSKSQFEKLGGGPFHVSIETAFKDSRDSGEINYGEAVITGSSSREIIFSTYICHPSMANNELSGPTLAASIMKYLLSMDNFYTYRFLFFPETIGAIAYISDNLVKLKSRTVAGWVLTCLGDPGKFSHVTSRYANNFADRLTREVFSSLKIPYNEYSWLERGSDERQYCSPGVDLPFCTLTRSKFGTFKEYHTSLDNLSFVTPGALRESYEVLIKLIEAVETKRLPDSIYLCEPQMSKRSLYPPISQTKTYGGETRHLMNVLSYCDGQNTIEEITEKTNLAYAEVNYFLNILLDNQLIKF